MPHDEMDRRLLLSMMALGSAALPAAAAAQVSGQAADPHAGHKMPMAPAQPADMDHSRHNPMTGPRPVIAMLVHPNMVLLDLCGPQTILKIAGCDIHLVWKNKTPVSTDVGVSVTPTMTFDECPKNVDVIFVPGGVVGTAQCMEDQEVLDFIADRGSRARYVTSVCTGAMVLGAAGLLKGYRAGTLWAILNLLPLVGAIPSEERVVTDRNRITGGGVTAGIDFGLTLAAVLRGEETARRAQLITQYDPHPPFNAGSPKGAGAELTNKVLAARTTMDAGVRKAAEAAGARLGIARNG